MKIIVNNLIPFQGFIAMNLFGFLFVRKDLKDKVNERVINHESIHTAQMKEMLYIFFYIWYLIEWFINVFRFLEFHEAYRNIKFEKEAFTYQDDYEYLSHRKKWAWIKM